MKKTNILVMALSGLFAFAALGLAQETKTDASQTAPVAAAAAPVLSQQQTKETGKKVRKQAVKKHNKIKKSTQKKSEEKNK